MTRWILGSIFVSVLAVGTAGAQTASPAKPAAPTAKPAAPQTPTAKPAPPTTAKPAAPTAKPAAPAASAAKYGPGIYAHFTTSNGNFIIKFFDKDAPNTVQNFVGLAEGKKPWRDPRTGQMVRRRYYRNVLFHRVIPNFMIQGGDPTGTGSGGPGYTFPDEISPNHRHDKPGIVSMANHGPNTNSGQFFITVAAYPSLDGKYSIFGEVVEGLDNVVAISKVPRSMTGETKDRPLKPVVINSVRIERVL